LALFSFVFQVAIVSELEAFLWWN